MDKKALLALLNDKQLLALVSRYDSPADDLGRSGLAARLKAYSGQLLADRFVLPIAGIQGSGKSTLLNALAFDEPVLPIDADETTCVPVEIGWAPNPKPQATVHFADGRTDTLPCTEEALRLVVHNEHNPGNEKQVSRVVLESNREMFRHGLVLVDLPGTGSLTAANMATTQHYLAEAVGVIFMLRTVPPLTRSEATFVSLQWASLRTAIFVQNRWNDETDNEALAGRDHNAKVLKQIAEQARIPLNEPPFIRVVNGYDALRAALSRDSNLANFSGLGALRLELERFGDSWVRRVGDGVLAALGADLAHLAKTLDAQLDETRLDRCGHEALMAEEARRFADHMQGIDQRAAEMRGVADSFRQNVRQVLREWSKDKSAELRNRMRTKMRAGIVDGPRLARALIDEQAQATDDIFMEIQEQALVAQDHLRSDLEGLDAWSAEAPDIRFTVDKEESTKWENLGGRIGTIAGGLGGGAAGIWAAAEVGALIGSAGGPIGTAVGAVVGSIFGGLAGLWVGNKAKEGATVLRVKAVEGDVFAAIDSYVAGMSAALNGVADSFRNHLDELLQQWRASRTDAFEQERQRSLAAMNLSHGEKMKVAEALGADLATLKALQAKLSEVGA
jgi:hypothetical protein